MADEQDEVPSVSGGNWGASEGRHAGETNAVFDDPEELAVGEFLGSGAAEVGRLGIETATHHRVGAAVVAVADRAVVSEVEACRTEDFRRGNDGIFGVFG